MNGNMIFYKKQTGRGWKSFILQLKSQQDPSASKKKNKKKNLPHTKINTQMRQAGDVPEDRVSRRMIG